jgi:hypothetical protein
MVRDLRCSQEFEILVWSEVVEFESEKVVRMVGRLGLWVEPPSG